jgi:hypothetical protein
VSDKILGLSVPAELHAAAHATARLQGKTLTDWLMPIIQQNINPLFLSADAQQIDLKQSTQKARKAS